MSGQNHDYSWYYSSPQRPQQHQQDGQHPQPAAMQDGRVVENGQRLLAVYPPASATPVHHVATHISNIRTSAGPTFAQPSYGGSYPPLQGHGHAQTSYQSEYSTSAPQGNIPPPPYSEYDSRLHYLAQPQGSSLNDSGFWENTRNDAVRMVNDHAGPTYPYRNSYSHPQASRHAHSHWTPPSSHQTTPFAQSVLQRTAPSSAYPTPPPAPPQPPGISASSSSLAWALGAPPPSTPNSRTADIGPLPPVQASRQGGSHGQGPNSGHGQSTPAHEYGYGHGQRQTLSQRPYQPQEAHNFYENFLDRKARQVDQYQQQQQSQFHQPPLSKYASATNGHPSANVTPNHNRIDTYGYNDPRLNPSQHHSSLPPRPVITVPQNRANDGHSPASQQYPQLHALPPRPPSVPGLPQLLSHNQHQHYVHSQPHTPQDLSPAPRPATSQLNQGPELPQSPSREGLLSSTPNRRPSLTSVLPSTERPITPPSKPLAPDSSPDPLALRPEGDGVPESIPSSSRPLMSMETGTVTPRKRKPVVEIVTPSKRLHMMKTGSSSSIGSTSIGETTQTFSQPLGLSTLLPKTPSTQSSVPVTPSTSHSLLSIPSSEASVESTPFYKKVVNKAYVSITPRAYLTPKIPGSSTKRMRFDSDEDAEGDGVYEDSMAGSPVKANGRAGGIRDSAAKSSSRRTGDRDSRIPLEKLVSLIEDIFEAEDTLPPGSESDCFEELKNHEFFSVLSKDPSRPMLNEAAVRKLTKYVGYVGRAGKRGGGGVAVNGVNGIGGTPRTGGTVTKGKTRLGDVDTQMLARLLKILERGVRVGEDVEGFPKLPLNSSVVVGGHDGKSPTKRGAKKGVKGSRKETNARRSRSRTPNNEDEEGPLMDVDGPEVSSSAAHNGAPTEEDLEKLSTMLELARDSILAAECVIALLGGDRLPKQLYSEELIMSCLNAIKNQLTNILYPFVEASSLVASSDPSFSAYSPLLGSILKTPTSPHRPLLQSFYQALSAVLPRITNLVNGETVAMSDTIIISGVYIAIGPFFVTDGGDGMSERAGGKKEKESIVAKTLGRNAMRAIRLDALSLIRSIFANHETQRSWIIEEILTSLIKLNDTRQKVGQFRLRDGHSIRTVSALLLQLVQTSAHDVRIAARKIARTRQNKLALRRQESLSESQGGNSLEEPFLDETDIEELKLYSTSLESATKAAKTIIIFLTQRSGKGKATKNSNEAEYRAILDNLIEDLLAVLFWPEWPAAGLILGIAMKFMFQSLDDVKSNSQTDNNAAKQMALEHLGVIAAKIRTSKLKFHKDAEDGRRALKPLDELVSSVSLKSLNRFLDAHNDVTAHLCKRQSEDQAYDSARELTAAMLGQELSSALKNIRKEIECPEASDDLNIKDTKKLLDFGLRLKMALRDVWNDPAGDVFNVGSQEEAQRIDGVAEELGTVQSLRNTFNPVLNVVLRALDAPAIFMRTKALKALGQIITSDASILSASNVRRGIESHLLDSSPQVRDAAVELIGKYMIDAPAVAGDYYSKIADRMADTGLGVRKRVIKLLKSFYVVTEDTSRKIDIATRLVLRMLDEDESVNDLAIKSIEELWFPPQPLPSALKTRTLNTTTNNPHDKGALLAKVSVIMGTAANFKDRHSPLEDVLHMIMKDKEGVERNSLHSRYGEICEALIDGLVDASDLPGFTVTNCVRTIHLLTSAYPSVLSGTNASTLLPYLKNPSSPEELLSSDYLLKIFRVSIPCMPKTAAKFGQELQATLQPMIIKPSGAGGIQILQETVGCMCVVVQHLTHDFVRLINLLKSCNGRLQQMLRRPANDTLSATDLRTSIMLIFIVSLLAENCDFDKLRTEHPDFVSDLNGIAQGSIIEHVYLTMLTLYEKFDNSTLRARVLQCLGFLFRAQPTLMTMERSSLIMDQIFASSDEEAKGRLLKIIQEFLVSEAEKHTALEKASTKTKGKANDVNMEELVGNTDGFADSGVSSAIVQRYLDHVLEAALSQDPQIQAVAIDVLSFTVKQGLAHPLQSFPVIVALETSTVQAIHSRASGLHAILQAKHSSLLNARYTVSARMSFDYQKKVAAGSIRGFRMQPTPIALLQRWYSHIREKRAIRQDFLKALVKIFQESESFESSQDDVDYTRYMAENFASFDYKTQEEVFTVIKFLTNILSTTGMQLLEIISPSHLLTHLHASSQPDLQPSTQDVASNAIAVAFPPPDRPPAKQYDRPALMRTSVIIAMVMLLKTHLKHLYSLSEEKCIKFVVGKKSAIGDKPVGKRNDNPISWNRLSFAITPLLTTEDAEAQKIKFLEIWNEDGLTAEPEDEEFM